MTNGGNLIDWVKEKFLGQPPQYQPPPIRFIAPTPPRPIPVPPANAVLVPAEQPVASLVGNHLNSRGRAQDAGSLVGGR